MMGGEFSSKRVKASLRLAKGGKMKKSFSLLFVCLMVASCLVLAACQGVDSSNSSFVAGKDHKNDASRMGLREPSADPNPISSTTFYLKRGEHFYILSGYVENPKETDPTVGFYDRNESTLDFTTIDMYSTVGATSPEYNGHTMLISFGNVPLATFEKGDQIIGTRAKGAPTFYLKEVEFVGCSIWSDSRSFIGGDGDIYDGSIWSSEDRDTKIPLNFNVERQLVITDSKGNPVDDIYNLKYGEKYTVPLNKYSEIQEMEVVADCSVYGPVDYKVSDVYDYAIEGTPTPEGYYSYDLSGIKPGLYYCSGHGVIEIK